MGLRTSHGARAENLICVETLPADEQPQPVPVDLAKMPAPLVRREDGTVADSTTAKRLGARGGLAKAAKRASLQRFGLKSPEDLSAIAPYYRAGKAFQKAAAEEYALASGGVLGPTAEAMVGTAAIALAASRYFTDKAFADDTPELDRGDYFSRGLVIGDKMRQMMLTALEVANRFGKARGQQTVDPYAILARIEAIVPPKYDFANPEVIDVVAEHPAAEG